MKRDDSYAAVLSRRNAIMKASVGIDYAIYETGKIGFDYERLMRDTGYDLARIRAIQHAHGVGSTPLKEMTNLTALVRKTAAPGKGARIFVKDEAQNDSGSFKARRASIACHRAKELGFAGVIAATSGNYGAAVASQAAKYGLKCIVVQECYDSQGIGQPEIIEKARACEAYGAEVVQLTVGPELFYVFLSLLETTGYFNASLYTPFGVAGVETLGAELIEDCLAITGRLPACVVVTNAGGGNLTGTARGIRKTTGQHVPIVAASVNLKGLHMASDHDFNLKSFTTGHTGFGMPYMTNPDRSDVPRSAARPLRYVDRYVTVNQGEVFFVTEALTALEGIERGPAGNISLAAAFSLARELGAEEIVVVQETEYTSAGKHHQAQLSFARSRGVEICFGDPRDEVPGKSIILPSAVDLIRAADVDLDKLRASLVKNQVKDFKRIGRSDFDFLMAETNATPAFVANVLTELGVSLED